MPSPPCFFVPSPGPPPPPPRATPPAPPPPPVPAATQRGQPPYRGAERRPSAPARPHSGLPAHRADLEPVRGAMQLGVDPPHQPLAFEQRHDVVAVLPLRRRHEGLAAEIEAEQAQRPPAIMQDRIERAEQPDAGPAGGLRQRAG